MRVNIRVDAARFDREADAYIDKVVRPAEAAGLNKAAQLIKVELQEATKTAFNKPKPFTQSAFTLYRATARKGKEPKRHVAREVKAELAIRTRRAES